MLSFARSLIKQKLDDSKISQDIGLGLAKTP
jgi:hypothetical protein